MSDTAQIEADVAFVLTPPGEHFSCALTLLEHGRHLFVEKPLALSANEAHHLTSAADGRVLFPGYTRLFDDAVRRLKVAVKDDPPIDVQIEWSRQLAPLDLLQGCLPHDLAMLIHLGLLVEVVNCTTSTDGVVVEFRWPGGSGSSAMRSNETAVTRTRLRTRSGATYVLTDRRLKVDGLDLTDPLWRQPLEVEMLALSECLATSAPELPLVLRNIEPAVSTLLEDALSRRHHAN